MVDLRTKYLWATLVSLALLATVLFVEIIAATPPNPLMVLNTFCLFMLCFLLLAVTWFYPKKGGQHVFAYALLFFCSLGLLFSMRHTLLQYFYPPAAPLCFSNAFSVSMLLSFEQWLLFLRDAWMSGVNCPHGQVALFGVSLNLVCLCWYSIAFMFVCFQLCHVAVYGIYEQKLPDDEGAVLRPS